MGSGELEHVIDFPIGGLVSVKFLTIPGREAPLSIALLGLHHPIGLTIDGIGALIPCAGASLAHRDHLTNLCGI